MDKISKTCDFGHEYWGNICDKCYTHSPVPDKIETPWDKFVDASKEILFELKQLNKIRDWLIEKSKDKPVGEKYSYDEVAVLISEWQSKQ